MTYGVLEIRGRKESWSHRATALKKFGEWFVHNPS